MSDLKAISDTNPHDTAEEILALARAYFSGLDPVPELVVKTPPADDDDTPEVSFEMLDESGDKVRAAGHPGGDVEITIYDSVNCRYDENFVKAIAQFSPTRLRIFATALVALAERCESLAEELGVDDR